MNEPSHGVLVCEVGGARIAVWGEALEWLAEKGGYENTTAMINDPDARDRVTVAQLLFAHKQSVLNRARRRDWR